MSMVEKQKQRIKKYLKIQIKKYIEYNCLSIPEVNTDIARSDICRDVHVFNP